MSHTTIDHERIGLIGSVLYISINSVKKRGDGGTHQSIAMKNMRSPEVYFMYLGRSDMFLKFPDSKLIITFHTVMKLPCFMKACAMIWNIHMNENMGLYPESQNAMSAIAIFSLEE